MLVTVGRVGRAHGIRGDVSVEVRTDVPELRFAEGAVLTTVPAAAGPLTVSRVRWHGDRLLVRFKGVPDRTAAERLRGVLLQADVDEQERTGEPDEFPDHRLVGLSVRTPDGTKVGEISEVVHLPGHDLLAVRRADRAEVLVPFAAEIVPEVDLDEGQVTIDPPPGLLDPPEAQEAGE